MVFDQSNQSINQSDEISSLFAYHSGSVSSVSLLGNPPYYI